MKHYLSVFLSLILLFSGVNVNAAPKSNLIDTIVVTVNDEPITQTELNAKLKIAKRELKRQQRPLPTPKALQEEVINQMITDSVLLQMAREQNIEITPDKLSRALEKIAEENHLTIARLKNNLRNNGLKFDEYKKELKKQMIIAELQRREFAGKITVSEAEVSHYLQSHPLNKATEYHIGHILVSLPENPTPADIQKGRKKAEGLKARLATNQEFKQLALADGADEAIDGSDLGYRSAGELPILFARSAPHMKKGELSDIIQDESGFHIFKLYDKRSPEISAKELNETKAEIRTHLFQAKLATEINNWLRQIVESADVDWKIKAKG